MIDNTKEYIACPAIHYDNGLKYAFMSVYGIETGFVLCGFRHPYISSILPTNVHFDRDKNKDVLSVKWDASQVVHKTTQGFITSYGRFVDRKEARTIAINCGQVKEEELHSDNLYSEDIFKFQKFYAKDDTDDAKDLIKGENLVITPCSAKFKCKSCAVRFECNAVFAYNRPNIYFDDSAYNLVLMCIEEIGIKQNVQFVNKS